MSGTDEFLTTVLILMVPFAIATIPLIIVFGQYLKMPAWLKGPSEPPKTKLGTVLTITMVMVLCVALWWYLGFVGRVLHQMFPGAS